MNQAWRLAHVSLALLAGACTLPPSYSSDVTLFGTGITSLETANDSLYQAVGNQAEKEVQMLAAKATAGLVMSHSCNYIPSSGDDAKRQPCLITIRGETALVPLQLETKAPCVSAVAKPPVSATDAPKAQAYLARSKECLDIIRQYELALSALVSSTDAATAAKDNQSIGTSLSGIGTAVGSKDVNDKGNATAASASAGASLSLFSAALAQWQYDQFKSAVLTADDPIQQMTKAIKVWVGYGLDYLSVTTYGDVRGENQLEILKERPLPMKPPERSKEVAAIFATADRINLIQASYMLEAVSNLGIAHKALADSLKSHDNGLTAVITAMNNFSIAAARAQTALQQLTTPIASPSP